MFRSTISYFRNARVVFQRKFSSAVEVPEPYAKPVQYMHWAMGGAILGCVGFVKAAQYSKGKAKGNYMFYHKSCGLLAMGLLFPRLAIRLTSKTPKPIGESTLERLGADASHVVLYVLMTVLPITGTAMGYYGGKGLPFFWTTISGAPEANKSIAGNSFKIHKQAGVLLEYMIPLHLAGSAFHAVKGQAILSRIVPMKKPVV